MANTLRSLVAAIVCAPCLVHAQADVGSVLLNPSAIRITGQFETSPGPTPLELALRAIGQQIDQKRAADAAQSPLEPLWKEPLWKYLPADPAGTLNSPVGALPDNLARNPLHLDDRFSTPVYLTLPGQQLDYELALSEKRTLWFFGH
ncbi:MAG: hypothetical protein QOC70_486 [Verrucomicrobiota bacterium]|jgi:hypothetical protein